MLNPRPRRRLFALMVPIALTLSVVTLPARVHAAEPTVVMLQMRQPAGLSGRVLLNGIEIDHFDEAGTLSSALNLWLRPGSNEVVVELDKSKPAAAVDGELKLRVGEAARGQEPEDLPALATLTWQPGGSLPTTLRANFKPKSTVTAGFWTKAQRVPLDAAAKQGLADVVAQVHFTGGGLDRELGLGQKIVRTMHAALRGRFLVLLDCHG